MELVFDGNRIQTVTAQGVVYLDDNGVEQVIDFAQCYETYLAAFLSPEMWERTKVYKNQSDDDRDAWVEKVKQKRCVGNRNILTPPWANGPYIEFYTQPMIRFKFATEAEFNNVHHAIKNADYRTIDNS